MDLGLVDNRGLGVFLCGRPFGVFCRWTWYTVGKPTGKRGDGNENECSRVLSSNHTDAVLPDLGDCFRGAGRMAFVRFVYRAGAAGLVERSGASPPVGERDPADG